MQCLHEPALITTNGFKYNDDAFRCAVDQLFESIVIVVQSADQLAWFKRYVCKAFYQTNSGELIDLLPACMVRLSLSAQI